MTKKTAQIEKVYRILGVISICAVLLLILVGGIVRATGSGMGCPDWPKCYGQWVPPTDVSQLPANYLEEFDVYGHGLEAFNAAKTWTEYVNRLIGVLIGFLVFATAIASFAYRKTNKKVFGFSVAAFLLTGFEGVLGALVVRLNLEGWSVTVHMFMAMVILLVLVAAVHSAFVQKREKFTADPVAAPQWVRLLGFGVLAITLLQIVFGSQVRENIDQVAILMDFGQREMWVSQLGGWFTAHRLFYMAVAAGISIWAIGLLKHFKKQQGIRWMAIAMVGGVFVEILLGIFLVKFDIPPVLQPLHLALSSLIFTLEITLLMQVFYLSKVAKEVASLRAGRKLSGGLRSNAMS